MRRRFVIAVVPLLLLLIAAVVVPAAMTSAERQTSALLSDRLLDASRFASITQDALSSDDLRLKAELDAYAELYGTRVWLIGRDGEHLHTAGSGAEDGPPEEALPMIAPAMAGSHPTSERTLSPFGPETMTLVTPVGHDSQVSAALVLEFPTATARQQVLRGWSVIAVAAAVPALALFAAIWPIANWVLRPLRNLQRSINKIRGGELDVLVDTEAGPPELRDVARSFNSMSGTVRFTLERQQQFVADASHQLRNPLASMQIGLENLRPHFDGDPDSAEAHEEAVQTVERMDVLVDDLLEASLLTSGETPVRRCSIHQLPHAGWLAAAETYGGHLQVDLKPADVVEPTGGVETLVDELLGNAFRLGRAAEVTIRGQADQQAAVYRLAVDDDGQGLDPEELQLAGTRSWRSAKVQGTTGSGLGLNILRQGVSDVGGSFTLSSSPAGGLRVDITLPLAEAD